MKEWQKWAICPFVLLLLPVLLVLAGLGAAIYCVYDAMFGEGYRH